MSVGVFTRIKRVEFVSGWETGGVDNGGVECGPGTLFPIECTLDQIAEIFHRVKDAKFSSGSISWVIDGAFGVTYIVSAPTTIPTSRCTQVSGGTFMLRRGYCSEVESGTATISAHNDPYLDEEYDAGDLIMFRDILDNERGIYLQGSVADDVLPWWNYDQPAVVNAFTFYSYNDPFETGSDWFTLLEYVDPDPTPSPGSIEVRVDFTGQIGVIKASSGDSDFAVSNRYFLGCRFYAPYSYAWTFSTYLADVSGTPYTPCSYVIRLESGDISCPVYVDETGYEPPNYISSGADFVHEATEWWPYKRLAEPNSIWDSATGEPVPIDAPFAAMDLDNSDMIPLFF